MYVILQYVIFEWKLSFYQELKIEKMTVSDVLRIYGTFAIQN